MKKVIAAAAGLMLVGTMVGTASAAVSLSGDARFRGYYETNYDLGAVDADGNRVFEEEEFWASRVRIKFDADAKGGAYARARVRMADSTWDGTRQTRDRGAGSNSYVDYAYIGIPIGPVTVEGGLMPLNTTKWFAWDRRGDMAQVKWQNDMTGLELWYIKDAEFTNPDTDLIDDEDINTWVAAWTQKFAGDFGLAVYAAYTDDATPADESGFQGTVHVGGPAGPVSLEAELSYIESDLVVGDSDGWGGYISGGMDVGAADVTIMAGATSDGFAADNDFGFIMIGGAASITPSLFDSGGTGIGNMGDTWFVGGITQFQVSEALSLKGILAYADIDEFGDFFEISGSLGYAISDGAKFSWDIGYLDASLDNGANEESPFGTAVTFEISY